TRSQSSRCCATFSASFPSAGHMVKGLSIVWGGLEGCELDLSRTLPEQRVHPNDVLRVLVEIYEGGARSLRADRLEREWRLLQRLALRQPAILRARAPLVAARGDFSSTTAQRARSGMRKGHQAHYPR